MSKLGWIIAGGIGYLVGSKSGHGPYDAVSRKVGQVASDPRVQSTIADASGAATGKAKHLAAAATGVVSRSNGTPAPQQDYVAGAGPQGPLP